MVAADLDLEPLIGGKADVRRLGAIRGGDAGAVAGDAQATEAAIGLADGEDAPVRPVAPLDRAAAREGRLARRAAIDPVVHLAQRRRRGAIAPPGGPVGAPAGGEQK